MEVTREDYMRAVVSECLNIGIAVVMASLDGGDTPHPDDIDVSTEVLVAELKEREEGMPAEMLAQGRRLAERILAELDTHVHAGAAGD